jgi:hypothetical protein
MLSKLLPGIPSDSEVKRYIKVVREEKLAPVENAVLYDLSLNIHGPEEDKVYALNPALMTNLRRGNTFMEIED